MNEILTMTEIESRFPSEWILIGEPETDESLQVLSGEVLYHSKTRNEVYQKAIELRPKRFAFHFTGKMPANKVIIL